MRTVMTEASGSTAVVTTDEPAPSRRRLPVRFVRVLLRRSFLALLAYPGATAVRLLAQVFQHGLETLKHGGTWQAASYLDRTLPYLKRHPVVIAPAALIVVLFVLLGWLAQRDYQR
ncbi:MAG: hypothetical protein ACRDHE_01490 [Ktedonobacterales bacterium]